MYVAEQLHAPTVSTKTSSFSDALSCCSASRSAGYRSSAGKWGRWRVCCRTSGCQVDTSKDSINYHCQSWSELTGEQEVGVNKNKYVHAVWIFSKLFYSFSLGFFLLQILPSHHHSLFTWDFCPGGWDSVLGVKQNYGMLEAPYACTLLHWDSSMFLEDTGSRVRS